MPNCDPKDRFVYPYQGCPSVAFSHFFANRIVKYANGGFANFMRFCKKKKKAFFSISLPGLSILSCIEPLIIINWYCG